jgi:branched-chain amino acid transport system substrate-binding protein
MPRKLFHPLQVVLSWLFLAVFLIGCSPAASTPDSPAEQPAEAAGQPVATDVPAAAPVQPIRVGASISLTGRYERTGAEMNHGYELCADKLNAEGGILGRPLEYIIYDDQSDPETGARLYEKLISEDNVDVILGPYSSPVTIPASAVTERLRYPMIASGASASDIWSRGFDYVFGIYTGAPFYLEGAVDIAAREGLTKVAVLTEDGAFAIDAVRGAMEFAEEAGLEIVHYEEYGRDVTDLSAAISKARAAGAEVLLGGTYGPDAELIVRQSVELGFTPRIFAFTVGPALPDFGENMGQDAELIFGATQWEPTIQGPGVEEFVQAYWDRYGYEPGYHAAGGFGACELLKYAIEEAGSVDQEKIRDALASLDTVTVYGAYRVDETGAQVAKPSYLIQWQNGKRVIVWPFDAAEADYILP